jgi:hypothetical protein
MKQMILIVATLLSIVLIAEPIEFSEIGSVPLSVDGFYVGSQLIDTNGNGTDEILVYDCQPATDQLDVRCYLPDGTLSWEKLLPHTHDVDAQLAAHAVYHNSTLYLLISDTESMVSLELFNLSTETLLDSYAQSFGCWGNSTIFSTVINDELCCFIGLDLQGTGYNEAKLLTLKLSNDSLTDLQITDDCGIMAMDLGDGTHFASCNSHGSGDMGNYSGAWETCIQDIADFSITASFGEQSYSIEPGSSSPLLAQYHNCLRNVPTAADRVIIYHRYEVDYTFHSEGFDCYDLNGTLLWSNASSQIGTQPMDACSWLPVNGQDNYLLYTRGTQAEIRNTETGAILHHQPIPVALDAILTNSDNEHYFFALDAAGETLSIFTLAQPVTVGAGPAPVLPAQSYITNYPNPFKPSAAGRGPITEIRFQISDARQLEHAEIEIYNAKGQIVNTLKADVSSRAKSRDLFYSVPWNGTDSRGKILQSGIYFSRLAAGNRTLASSKMILMK